MSSLDMQIACLKKELKRRKVKYPLFVEEGKMPQDRCVLEIQLMSDALQTLTQLRGILNGI